MPEPHTCSRFQELIERFVDGELTAAEADFVRAHAAACPACREELARAREVVRELRRLPPLSCPPQVTAAVLARAAAEAGEERPAAPRSHQTSRRGGGWWRRLSAAPAWRPLWGPALAAAAAAAFLASALLLPHPAPSPAGTMSAAELAETEQEIKLAFAYIGRVGRQAGDRVSDEMVDQVLTPTRRAMGLQPGEVR